MVTCTAQDQHKDAQRGSTWLLEVPPRPRVVVGVRQTGVCCTPRLCRRRGLLPRAPHRLGPPQHGFLKCLEVEEEPLFELVWRLPTFHTERGKDLGIKLPTALRDDGIGRPFCFNKLVEGCAQGVMQTLFFLFITSFPTACHAFPFVEDLLTMPLWAIKRDTRLTCLLSYTWRYQSPLGGVSRVPHRPLGEAQEAFADPAHPRKDCEGEPA